MSESSQPSAPGHSSRPSPAVLQPYTAVLLHACGGGCPADAGANASANASASSTASASCRAREQLAHVASDLSLRLGKGRRRQDRDGASRGTPLPDARLDLLMRCARCGNELLELIPQPPIALDRLLSEGCLDQLHVIVDRFEDLCLVKRGDTPDCCVVRLVCGDSRCGDGRGRGRRWALRTFLASGVSTPCVRRSMMTA